MEDMTWRGGYCEVIDPESSQQMRDIGWSAVRSFFRRASGGQPDTPLPEPPQVLPQGSSSTEPQPLLLLLKTMVVAATKHLHQTRKVPRQTKCINHPLAVARMLAESGVTDLPALQAALLHNVLEDTDATRPELEALFGREVGELLNSLTDDDSCCSSCHRKLKPLRSALSLPLKELGRGMDGCNRISSIPSQAKEVLSLLLAAEFVANSCPSNRSCTLLQSLKLAELLAQRGVHDPETLQAALLCGGSAGSDDPAVLDEFGAEVMGTLHALRQPPSVQMPHKAKLILLGQHLLRLRDLQVGHLKDVHAEQAFVEVLEEAKTVRGLLRKTHAELEQGLDEAFTGQVRLANGSLTSTELITGSVPASAVEA